MEAARKEHDYCHVHIIPNYFKIMTNYVKIMTDYVKIMTNYDKIMTDYVSRRPDIPALVDWA